MAQSTPPEFDQYARDYRDMHAESIRISGEDPDYFARYKVEEVARVSVVGGGNAGMSILDFGCGIGSTIPWFKQLFPAAELFGTDVSDESLNLARERLGNAAQFDLFDEARLPYGDDRFDLVFTSCVFHHIPPRKRSQALREIHRVLKPGGELFFFEHNPWNPLTLKVVRDCPFDENAILLNAPEAARLISDAGFGTMRTSYTVFFPRFLSALRPLERFLRVVPIGGQYFVHARV